MKIVDPMRNPDAVAASTCACICDTGSAYWKASGENYSSHCGCQCIEGNTTNVSANFNAATAKA